MGLPGVGSGEATLWISDGFDPKQQKGTDLDLTGGQEDIEYCRGLKEQQGPTGNKEGWQLFVERPGVWVSNKQISMALKREAV